MAKFPVDAPKTKVLRALGSIGFHIVREHIALAKDNADGTQTPLTIPNHAKLKSSTWRGI